MFRGLSLIRINLNELYHEVGKVENRHLHRAAGEIVTKSRAIRVTRGEIERSLKVCVALRNMFEKYRLDAASIRCLDTIWDIDATVCLAASLLNGEILIVGCEMICPPS